MQSSTEITEILRTNWESIKNTIKNEAGITDISYKTWIDPLTVYGFENNTVKILIPSDNSIALILYSKSLCWILSGNNF